MPKLVTKITNALEEHLRPGEELRSVGQLIPGFSTLWLNHPALRMLSLLTMKAWWAGVTHDRLILIQLDSLSRPRADCVQSIPLNKVEIQENVLLIDQNGNSEGRGYTLGMNALPPQRFLCHFGNKHFTGLDVKQFLIAISTRGR